MPNTKDFKGGNEKFLLIGQTGSGKTSLFATLPGRKFLYVFDPNSLNTLAGDDIDYEEFLPDRLNMNVVSLTKGVGDRTVPLQPETYIKWEADFEKKIQEGFFKKYDVLGFDSFTTLSDLVMDRVLFINGRFGKQPEQPDWSAQINTLKNIFRQATSLDLIMFATAHKDLKQDELSKKVEYQIMMPGQLRTKLPLLFSEIYHCDVVTNEKGEASYRIQTKPDRYNPVARCTLGLDQYVDVTIPKDAKDKTRFGLGKILSEHPRNKEVTK